MASSGQRGPYAKSEAVRRHIVESCIEVFGETGYQAATMAEVARRAGVSHTGLVHHFPLKEDLLLAVIELRDRQIADALLGAGSTGSASDLRAFLTGAINAGSSTGTPLGLLELDAVLSGEASAVDHPAHAALAKRYRGIRTFYARMLRGLRSEGRITVDIPPDTLALILLALTEGLRRQWFFDKDGVDITGSIDAVLDLLSSEE